MSRRNAIAAALVAVLAYLAVPPDTWAQTGWKVAIGFAAAGIVAACARRRHTPAAWYCFAAGIALNAAGSFAETFIVRVLHDDSWPTAASLFYQALYPALAVGLAVHIRDRLTRADHGLLVDTATVTVAVTLLSWVFVLRPTLADGSVPLLARLDGVGPAVGDLVPRALQALQRPSRPRGRRRAAEGGRRRLARRAAGRRPARPPRRRGVRAPAPRRRRGRGPRRHRAGAHQHAGARDGVGRARDLGRRRDRGRAGGAGRRRALRRQSGRARPGQNQSSRLT
jgi:hypothetical protein